MDPRLAHTLALGPNFTPEVYQKDDRVDLINPIREWTRGFNLFCGDRGNRFVAARLQGRLHKPVDLPQL